FRSRKVVRSLLGFVARGLLLLSEVVGLRLLERSDCTRARAVDSLAALPFVKRRLTVLFGIQEGVDKGLLQRPGIFAKRKVLSRRRALGNLLSERPALPISPRRQVAQNGI